MYRLGLLLAAIFTTFGAFAPLTAGVGKHHAYTFHENRDLAIVVSAALRAMGGNAPSMYLDEFWQQVATTFLEGHPYLQQVVRDSFPNSKHRDYARFLQAHYERVLGPRDPPVGALTQGHQMEYSELIILEDVVTELLREQNVGLPDDRRCRPPPRGRGSRLRDQRDHFWTEVAAHFVKKLRESGKEDYAEFYERYNVLTRSLADRLEHTYIDRVAGSVFPSHEAPAAVAQASGSAAQHLPPGGAVAVTNHHLEDGELEDGGLEDVELEAGPGAAAGTTAQPAHGHGRQDNDSSSSGEDGTAAAGGSDTGSADFRDSANARCYLNHGGDDSAV